MPAPLGNSNNRKWNTENAQLLVDDILEYIKNRKDCFSIAEASSDLGYYETILDYFKRTLRDVDFEPIKIAKEIVKARLIKQGLIGENNPTMSIFILKNNHDMQDKQYIDQRNTEVPLSEEEIKKAKEELDKEY